MHTVCPRRRSSELVRTMMDALLFVRAAAQAAAAPAPSDPIAAGWKPIRDDELRGMALGDGHRVVIRLASAYAPEHVANLKRLAKARWWDGESVYRVQETWEIGRDNDEPPVTNAQIVVRQSLVYK